MYGVSCLGNAGVQGIGGAYKGPCSITQMQRALHRVSSPASGMTPICGPFPGSVQSHTQGCIGLPGRKPSCHEQRISCRSLRLGRGLRQCYPMVLGPPLTMAKTLTCSFEARITGNRPAATRISPFSHSGCAGAGTVLPSPARSSLCGGAWCCRSASARTLRHIP